MSISKVCNFNVPTRGSSLTHSFAFFLIDEVTAALLHEISQILLAQDTSLQLVNSVLAELLIRYTNDRFDSPDSGAEFYRTLSLASHHLGDILPNALDVVRRGAKAFPLEVRRHYLQLKKPR